MSLWAGKEARTYLSTVEEDCKDSLRAVMDTLEDWTRPKSDRIAAFTHLKTLNLGYKILSTYIQEVRRVLDLCNFAYVEHCKDRLIRIQSWLTSQVQKLTKNVSQRVIVSPSMNALRSARQRMQHTGRYKPSDQSLQTAQAVCQYTG